MQGTMRWLALALALAAPPAMAATEIGAAVAITTVVTGATQDGEVVLATGDPVHADEVIATDDSGIGQFRFADDTMLAVGPRSTFTLDRFVYDPGNSAADIGINLTRGAFRFITGESPHQAYELTTPTATLGLRGTAFDVYVADDGETVVAMLDGAVEVCNRVGNCRVQDAVGRFLHIARDGVFSVLDSWDGPIAEQVAFARALPFLAREEVLLPAFRGSKTVVTLYLDRSRDALERAGDVIQDAGEAASDVVENAGEAAGNAVEQAGNAVERAGNQVENAIESIPRPRLPPRLRNPFR